MIQFWFWYLYLTRSFHFSLIQAEKPSENVMMDEHFYCIGQVSVYH